MPSSECYSLDDALYLMARLRDPKDGCPWDLKQSYNDIVPHTLEECYELADAIRQGDMSHTEEELGDVLFQVIFYAQLGKEDQHFDFDSIVHGLVDKLVRRHPHVFPNGDLQQRFGAQTKATKDIKATWEALKSEERSAKQQGGILDDVPLALPALVRAQKLQKRLASQGLDWRSLEPVFESLESELQELKDAISTGNPEHIADEAGDVLFSMVNVIRHLKLNAEATLRQSNEKFSNRIKAMEADCEKNNKRFSDLSDAQFEALWQQVKRQLHK